MEYVEGELLSQRVANGPLPVREAIEVGLQVADALDEAHSRGIIHRDIKSANLMRTERGLVKVLDFGLAKFIEDRGGAARGHAAAGHDRRDGARHRVVHGAGAGARPSGRSPRPTSSRSASCSSSSRPAGCRSPAASPTEIIDHILHEVPPPPSRYDAQIPAGFDAIVAHALEKVAVVPLPVGARDARRPARTRARPRRRAARHDEPHRGEPAARSRRRRATRSR